jgi:disulfide oxidoreductase YuzD
VHVEYVDAATPEVQAQYAETIEEAKQRYWPFPLVLYNDQVVLAGDVNVYRLSRMVRDELGTASTGA